MNEERTVTWHLGNRRPVQIEGVMWKESLVGEGRIYSIAIVTRSVCQPVWSTTCHCIVHVFPGPALIKMPHIKSVFIDPT